MPVDNVTANSPATSDWANQVADSVADIEATPGSAVATAAAGSSAVGDTPAAGSSSSISRADHRHGREGFANPGSSAVGDSVSGGAAATVARSDHRHGREAFGSVTNLTDTTAGSNGSASTVSRADHRHGMPAAHGRVTLGKIGPTITANQDDWAPTGIGSASVVDVTNNKGSIAVITGIVAGSEGDLLTLLNNPLSGFGIQLSNESTSSSSANRFNTGGGSIQIDPGHGVTLIYSASRWRTVIP